LNENPDQDELSYSQEFRTWAWNNKLYVGL